MNYAAYDKSTLDPQLSTINRRPSTLNPEPATLNPNHRPSKCILNGTHDASCTFAIDLILVYVVHWVMYDFVKVTL